jgi:hypothetical protein
MMKPGGISIPYLDISQSLDPGRENGKKEGIFLLIRKKADLSSSKDFDLSDLLHENHRFVSSFHLSSNGIPLEVLSVILLLSSPSLGNEPRFAHFATHLSPHTHRVGILVDKLLQRIRSRREREIRMQ